MKKVMFSILAMTLGFLISGCAAQQAAQATGEQVSLDYSPEYSVVVSPMSSVTISEARAYREGEEFVISGRVRRTHEINLPGHVDLAVCASDGTLLAQETMRVSGLHSNRKGVIELPFAFRLALIPPQGAKIRIEYHAPSSGDADLSCPKS
jgi:hypothetical protein